MPHFRRPACRTGRGFGRQARQGAPQQGLLPFRRPPGLSARPGLLSRSQPERSGAFNSLVAAQSDELPAVVCPMFGTRPDVGKARPPQHTQRRTCCTMQRICFAESPWGGRPNAPKWAQIGPNGTASNLNPNMSPGQGFRTRSPATTVGTGRTVAGPISCPICATPGSDTVHYSRSAHPMCPIWAHILENPLRPSIRPGGQRRDCFAALAMTDGRSQ